MIQDFFDWTFMEPAEKSLKREIIEILVLYVVFVLVLMAHERVPMRWMAASVILLVGLLWDNFRELLRVALVAGIIVFGLIRPYVVQAFYIPSRSMENTLLVDDHIFVNKFWYRVSNPDRWDVIVFEYPNDPSKDYIKRLVGQPGDTVSIENGRLHVNGDRIERRYVDSEVEFRFQGELLSSNLEDGSQVLRFGGDGLRLNATSFNEDSQNPVRSRFSVTKIYREAEGHRIKEVAYNGVETHKSIRSEFGPIRVPRRGETVQLGDLSALEKRFYFNLMDQWFEQQVSLRNGVFYLDGVPKKTLKIRERLYFAMGDNRDHSEDSRVWGFVPARRLLGEAFFIYWPPSRVGLIGETN